MAWLVPRKKLRRWIRYAANDECENYGGEKNHIYRSIRILALKVWGKKDVEEMESGYGFSSTQIAVLDKDAEPEPEK